MLYNATCVLLGDFVFILHVEGVPDDELYVKETISGLCVGEHVGKKY